MARTSLDAVPLVVGRQLAAVSFRVVLLRACAIAIFSLAVTGATLAGSGLVTAPHIDPPEHQIVDTEMLVAPPESGDDVELVKGPNIASLPDFEPLAERIEGPVLLKVGDNVTNQLSGK